MAPFGVANSLVLITQALTGRNLLGYRKGVHKSGRILGVPQALYSLAPACDWLVLSVLQ